jgi:hypothetical protein
MHSKKAKIHGLAARYGVGVHARDIWDEHPTTRQFTEKAFNRFGFLSLDANKNILVAEAIRDGVSAYNSASKANAKPGPAVYYLHAFFLRLSKALDHEIYVGGSRWQPLTMNLNDMVGGETVVSPESKKWKHKEMTSLKAILLSFMDEEASVVITGVKAIRTESLRVVK